jgi:hypothetical protein
LRIDKKAKNTPLLKELIPGYLEEETNFFLDQKINVLMLPLSPINIHPGKFQSLES